MGRNTGLAGRLCAFVSRFEAGFRFRADEVAHLDALGDLVERDYSIKVIAKGLSYLVERDYLRVAGMVKPPGRQCRVKLYQTIGMVVLVEKPPLPKVEAEEVATGRVKVEKIPGGRRVKFGSDWRPYREPNALRARAVWGTSSPLSWVK